jgi:hypothetical protein
VTVSLQIHVLRHPNSRDYPEFHEFLRRLSGLSIYLDETRRERLEDLLGYLPRSEPYLSFADFHGLVNTPARFFALSARSDAPAPAPRTPTGPASAPAITSTGFTNSRLQPPPSTYSSPLVRLLIWLS